MANDTCDCHTCAAAYARGLRDARVAVVEYLKTWRRDVPQFTPADKRVLLLAVIESIQEEAWARHLPAAIAALGDSAGAGGK